MNVQMYILSASEITSFAQVASITREQGCTNEEEVIKTELPQEPQLPQNKIVTETLMSLMLFTSPGSCTAELVAHRTAYLVIYIYTIL